MKHFVVLAMLVLDGPVLAAELGNPAAPLVVSEWVKGKPVDFSTAKDKRIVVVEFFPGTNSPNTESLSQLAEFQKKYQKVIVIGIGAGDAETVRKAVAANVREDYRLALDKDNQTRDGYLKAFAVSSVAHAFIIDQQGRVAWHGEPASGLEVALEKIMAGTYDLDAIVKQNAARRLG